MHFFAHPVYHSPTAYSYRRPPRERGLQPAPKTLIARIAIRTSNFHTIQTCKLQSKFREKERGLSRECLHFWVAFTLLSQKRLNLRTYLPTYFVSTFNSKERWELTKDHYKFQENSRGRSQGLQKIFTTPYRPRAHRAPGSSLRLIALLGPGPSTGSPTGYTHSMISYLASSCRLSVCLSVTLGIGIVALRVSGQGKVVPASNYSEVIPGKFIG